MSALRQGRREGFKDCHCSHCRARGRTRIMVRRLVRRREERAWKRRESVG